MNLTVYIKEKTKSYDFDRERVDYLSKKFSLIKNTISMMEFGDENEKNEIHINISHIKNVTFAIFDELIKVTDMVNENLEKHRKNIQIETNNRFNKITKENNRRNNLGDNVKKVPCDKNKIYDNTVKKYIIKNFQFGSKLHRYYKSIGKDLVVVINLSHYLGGIEPTISMMYFMIQMYKKDKKQFNKIYEEGKKYDPYEIFYEKSEINIKYHKKLSKRAKQIDMISKHLK